MMLATPSVAGTRGAAIAAWLAAALGAAIPLSTAASKLLLVLLLGAWLFLPERRARLRLYWQEPVARWSLLLFAALAVGTLHGAAPWRERLDILFKFSDLACVGLLVGLFPTARDRRIALGGFVAGMGLLLVLSAAMWLGLIPYGAFGKVGDGAVVVKLSITHNWLMAYFAFLCGLAATQASDRRWRAALWLAAGAAAANVLWMVGGRTGYLALAALLAYGLYVWQGLRGLLLAGAAIGVGAVVLLATSAQLAARVDIALADIAAWQPGVGAKTSLGQRFDWWHASLTMLREHPLAGVGTGSFATALAELTAGTQVTPSVNPHNAYFFMGTQLGLPGLALYLAFLGGLWRAARGLPVVEQNLLRALVVALAIGDLFNSLLLDHTEGLLFAWLAGLLAAARTPPAREPASLARSRA